MADAPAPQVVRRALVQEGADPISHRVGQGESLRALAADYGVSHEAVRRRLGQHGIVLPPLWTAPATPACWLRIHRLPGRGRSWIISPDELPDLITRCRAGESPRRTPLVSCTRR